MTPILKLRRVSRKRQPIKNPGCWCLETKKYLLFLPENELHEISLLFSSYLIKSRNNKIIYIPTNDKDNNFLANWLPKLDGILQSGMIPKIINQLKGEEVKKITNKKK